MGDLSIPVQPLNSGVYGDTLILNCPRCGDDADYLHHGNPLVYERPHDFHGPSVCRSVTGEVAIAAEGNPSGRRGGIRIPFECEACGEGLSLCLAQHKGQTFIWWETDAAEQQRAFREHGADV